MHYGENVAEYVVNIVPMFIFINIALVDTTHYIKWLAKYSVCHWMLLFSCVNGYLREIDVMSSVLII